MASRKPQRKKAQARRNLSPSKRPVILDDGTPEARARRIELVGAAADPALGVDPIGTLMARGQLGADQDRAVARLEAGRRFSELRSLLFGAMLPRETLLARAAPGGPPRPPPENADPGAVERERDLRDRYERALAALRGTSAAALEEAVQLCHWSAPPDWSFRIRIGLATLADLRARDDLLDGLDALAHCFGFLGRGGVAAPPRKKAVDEDLPIR